MNKHLYTLGLTLLTALLPVAAQAADVGVSINISQPGFYGRIDLGNVAQPALIYPRPIIITQRPMTVVRQPIYLRVPPGHEKHWDKNCHKYAACDQPVYFVQDNWYREVYVPRTYGAPQRHSDDRKPHKNRDKHGNGNSKGRDDRGNN